MENGTNTVKGKIKFTSVEATYNVEIVKSTGIKYMEAKNGINFSSNTCTRYIRLLWTTYRAFLLLIFFRSSFCIYINHLTKLELIQY